MPLDNVEPIKFSIINNLDVARVKWIQERG